MSEREKKTLQRDGVGLPISPDPVPTDPQDLLDLMDDAARYAAKGQGATAPAFDHGMRIFNQLNAHFQVRVARELGEAHHGLKRATDVLKVASWWLAGVTILLGALELVKAFRGH